MNSFHFPTDEVFNSSNIQSIEPSSDGTLPTYYFITFPMKCFVPCPSTLQELKGNGDLTQNGLGNWVMAFFLMFVGFVENDFYIPEKKKNCDNSSNTNPPPENNLENEDEEDVDKSFTATLGRSRVYMEYIINDASTPGNNFDEVSLIDCVGIRFCFAFYGDETDPRRALERLFRHIAAERTKRRSRGSNQKPAATARAGSSHPSILRHDQAIQDWMSYGQTALGYLECFNPDILEQVLPNGCPLFGSLVDFDQVFGHDASIDILERQPDDGVKVDVRQRSNPISNTGTLCFGIPALVYRFNSPWVNRVAMLYTNLPRSLAWESKPREIQVAQGALMSSFRSLNSPNTETFFRNMLMMQENKNDLLDISKMMQKRIRSLNCIEDSAERVRLKQLYRHDAVKRAQRIWNENANISKSIKKIVKWTEENETWTTPPKYQRMVDNHSLTSFGNMVARTFYCYEFDFDVLSNHDILFFVMVCAHNAYQYKLESLHLNPILLGAGTIGKSFILNKISKMFIDGTVEANTNVTEKAFALGENKNDHITLYHELPQRMLTTKGRAGAGDTGDTIFKDLLTNGFVTTVQPMVTDDNQRIELTFKSERVGCFISATNEREDNMHESLHSRFVCITVNERQRHGVTMLDKQISSIEIEEASNSARAELHRAGLLHRTRARQAMVAMVERAIVIGLLDEPDLSIAQHGVSKAVQVITTKVMKGAEYNNREITNIILFARTLTIMHACERFANDTTSPGYNKPFSYKNLLPIQDYLVCTEEIAVFTLSYFFERLLQGNAIKTMVLLLNSVKSDLQRHPDNNNLMVTDTCYYYTPPNYRTRQAIYSKMMATSSILGRSGEEKLSKENIMVCFNKLMKMSHNGESILKYEDHNGTIFLNRHYVDANFVVDKETGFFKSKRNFFETFKYVVKHAFSHKHQKPTENAILAFVRDHDYPFVLETMDLGVDKLDSYITTKNFSCELDVNTEDHFVRGDQVFVSGSSFQFRVDLQDLAYTEYYNRHHDHDPTDYSLIDSHEKLSTMHNPSSCEPIIPTTHDGDYAKYPESMLSAYKRVHKRKYQGDEEHNKRARLEDDSDDSDDELE